MVGPVESFVVFLALYPASSRAFSSFADVILSYCFGVFEFSALPWIFDTTVKLGVVVCYVSLKTNYIM